MSVDLAAVNARVLDLATKQSADITERLLGEHVTLVDGRGRLDGPERVVATPRRRHRARCSTPTSCCSRPVRGRASCDSARLDGERILSWRHLYALTELPERLIVVGSGRDRGRVRQRVRRPRLRGRARLVARPGAARRGRRRGAGAGGRLRAPRPDRHVPLAGRERRARRRRRRGHPDRRPEGDRVRTACSPSARSPTPRTSGLETTRVETDRYGSIVVDRVSRTKARGVYAAGDCTGVLPLASVAAMQGRIAMYHALGDAVAPLDLLTVSSNVFTTPEIATVGVSQQQVDDHLVPAREVVLRLRGNPRAKMQGSRDGFVKLFCRSVTGIVIGGVVVAPRASELIYPIALAISQRLTVDQLSASFTVYPSLSGSIAEAARRLHGSRSIT